MSIEPQNITFIQPSWEPTPDLRMVGRRRKNAELQQRWFNRATRQSEWREVPFVHEENN